MPEEALSYFQEIRSLRPFPMKVRYARLQGILKRLCIAFSADFRTDYSGLFSCLYAVCKHYGADHRAVDRLRRRARLALSGELVPAEADFRADCNALAAFAARLHGCGLPPDFEMPAAPEGSCEARRCGAGQKQRAVVTGVFRDAFTCRFASRDSAADALVSCTDHPELPDLLLEGMQLNLLNLREEHGRFFVGYVVVEPDFLIDVSTLTACCKPYGAHPYNYLIAKFSPREMTLPILLGNAANAFMDDCVNESDDAPATFRESMQKHFRESMLEYACLPGEVGKSYFDVAEQHFRNIRQAVRSQFPSSEVGIALDRVLLEPSFICEALGLRGRLDVMTMDHRQLVELKSGRAEDFRREQPQPRREHVLQMALYKEMLHYNFGLPYDSISAFLLYSRYPKFFEERTSAAAIRSVLALRNAIVRLEMDLRDGKFLDLLPSITVETVNQRRLNNKLFNDHLQPAIRKVTGPLHGMSDLERAYFSAYLAFLEREQFLAKTNDRRPDSNRGFSSLWTADTPSKLASGDILPDLVLTAVRGGSDIEGLTFQLPDYGEGFMPNFNEGEMVMLYARPDEKRNVTNSQLVRAYIEELDERTVSVSLFYKQRNRCFFALGTRYAIEHDASDMPFSQAYRGLFSLLTAVPERRALLLAQRAPEVGAPRPLLGTYSPQVERIVADVKRAKDYFLLIGPPGTGKTSVALRALVEEYLLERQEGRDSWRPLLLTAYTNRAVDEICSMLEEIELPMTYVRIGAEPSCHPRFRSRLLSSCCADCRKRAEVRDRLLRTPVFVGTVTTLTAHAELFELLQFEMAIIDEASQLLEPQVLGLLTAKHQSENAIGKFVMIGDHKQLPAVVLSPFGKTKVTDERLKGIGLSDLRNSLFERLHAVQQEKGWRGVAAMLDRQGRMHPEIGEFANQAFYGGQLQAIPLPHQEEALPAVSGRNPLEAFVASVRLGFFHVPSPAAAENNKSNLPEAETVAVVAETLIRLQRERGNAAFVPEKAIGIIVPFRNQVATIRRALRSRHVEGASRITIDTVECFQGSQRDCILFSTTISCPYQLELLSTVQVIDGIPVDRKLNVATTRARRQMFIVGDERILSHSPIYRRLLAACKRFDAEISFEHDAS